MDGQRFDQLTRSLAQVTTRRGALKTMLAGLAGGVAGLSRHGAEAQTRQPNGAPCVRATDCASLKCVDGVCCNTACTGQCEACNQPGREGVCSPVTGLPVGQRQTCPGSGPCQSACDGVKRTSCAAWPGAGTSCGAATCSNGWQTTYACGGNGTCHPTTTSCGLYLCNAEGTACRTSCAGDAECVGVAFCANGICQGDKQLGEACASADQCQSGYCIDGVCCIDACAGQCFACNVAGNAGFCTPTAGAACDDGDPCTIDDVCRNTGNCRGTPKDCSAQTDQCNTGICRAADGVCVTQPRANGTGCNADNNACTVDDTCQNGACVAGPPMSCPTCQACSGGSCQAVASDARCATVCCNGSCCAAGEACIGNTCRAACLPVRAMCDLAASRCCQDQPTVCSVEANCRVTQGEACCRPIGGACADRCDCCSNADCVGGRCRIGTGQQCVNAGECAGLLPGCCSGVCRELANDPNNCRECGRVCPAATIPNAEAACFFGTCITICDDGFTFCAGACVPLATDEANCGACGNACAAGWLCCGGTCRNVQTDHLNCGGCGDVCAIDDICVNGNCQLAVCKSNGDACDEASDCCSGLCNNICVCSPGDFPAGGACQTDANCCQGRCILGGCVCFDPGFPPAPGLNGPCLSDRDCCSGSCLLDPTGNVGLCTCRPIGVPCDNQFQCCSGNCNATPFGGRLCSPSD